MSSFNCEQCGALCVDSGTGFLAGCTHYPPDIPIIGSTYPCPDSVVREARSVWRGGVVFEGGLAVPLKQLRAEYILLTVPKIAINLSDNNNRDQTE